MIIKRPIFSARKRSARYFRLFSFYGLKILDIVFVLSVFVATLQWKAYAAWTRVLFEIVESCCDSPFFQWQFRGDSSSVTLLLEPASPIFAIEAWKSTNAHPKIIHQMGEQTTRCTLPPHTQSFSARHDLALLVKTINSSHTSYHADAAEC